MIEDDFGDDERDNRGSIDPTSYKREEAAQASRSCPHCLGQGLATVFDPDYDGSATVWKTLSDGSRREQAGRVPAYCICLLGRFIEANHRKNCSDVHKRVPDFADILGRSSYWLERDPTQRELTNGEVETLPAEFRRLLAERMRVTSGRDRINRMFDDSEAG